MSVTSDFSTSRDRDAWAAIRGFVYQVDVTLVRWLDLAEGELLELERGEDIDRITTAPDEQRLVEQVKSVTHAISLRSDRALEALANAVDHLASNPGMHLKFRFTTTASVAREQDHPTRGGVPGIHLWEQIRQGQVASDGANDLGTIRTLLVRAQRPSRTPEAVWAQARQTFSDETKLGALVARFEWATAEPPTETLCDRIVESLVQSGRAASHHRARQLYEQLFVRVFRVLAHPGLKRLSRAELDEESGRDGLAEADRALVQTFRLAFDRLHGRVEEVEHQLRTLGEQTRLAVGDVLPDAVSSSELSLEEIAIKVESVTGGHVEVLARQADVLFLWLKPGKLDRRNPKLLILAAACLLSGVSSAGVLELGFCDTAEQHGSRGDVQMGEWRVRVALAEAGTVARSKSVPDDFWARVEVLVTAGDNLRVGEVCMSFDEWEKHA